MPGFVIQGGDGQFGRIGPDGKLSASDAALVGSGGPGYTIADDPVRTDYARGTVAMARTGDPHSQAAQFFIVLSDDAAQSLTQSNQYGYAIVGTSRRAWTSPTRSRRCRTRAVQTTPHSIPSR